MPRRKKQTPLVEVKTTAEFVPTPSSNIPGHKTSFRKKGVTYNVGDIIIAGIGDESVQGELTSVLASQFVVTGDQCPHGRFFFYNGTKLELIESKVKPKRVRRTRKKK